MNKNDLIDSMGKIDDDMIRNVELLRGKKKRTGIIKWGAMVASLCLVIAGVYVWNNTELDDIGKSNINKNETSNIIVSENGITIPKINVSLSSDGAADMRAFFIYKGNCYVQYEMLEGILNTADGKEIVGEYLGTSTGLIDEWTSKDGYVELAGSIQGDFYSVKGYDPSFMLCTKWEETGDVEIFICNNGITLRYGEDVCESRFNLSENFVGLSYETYESWYYSKGEIHKAEESDKSIVEEFIKELNGAKFVTWDSVLNTEGQTTSLDNEIYHIYMEMKDIIPVRLRLYKDGYVEFDGIYGVCVQLPKDTFERLIGLFEG